MGMCYKKCGLLTDGAFPHRVAAATCCKTVGLGCLNSGNDATSQRFNVGGGAGDHDPSTPAEAHFPLQSLTEDLDSAGETKALASEPSSATLHARNLRAA
mmetsp:Transcript_12709/g.36525  ORF Transcript_12709/g.36525 Transcript_12709/m.36525 type:complete len:100 (+) Transcript_12709:1-300(+)